MVIQHDDRNVGNAEGAATRVMLVAEDKSQGELLSEILSVDGFDVAFANSGEHALGLYKTYKPDVILIDVVMRDMNGYQTARHIRDINPEIFIPIIFITSLDSPESMMACLENGGVDCLVKPYNPAVLNLKIQTYKEISQLHKTVSQQRDKLAEHAKYLESSYSVAENVFNKVMQSDVLKSDAIKYFLSSIAIFNGDILLAAYSPAGELHVMLGDFTGHGLSAAIGAIPVSDIYYGMTEKGFSISEIIEEINKKLYKILPRGLFLAACLIEYSDSSNKLTVWNAGLPDILIYDQSGNISFRAESKNYPLGINNDVSMVQSMDVYQLNAGEHILMFTDGLIEAKNPYSEQYGMQRVEEVIRTRQGRWKVEALREELDTFVGDNDLNDDLTMIEINLGAMRQPILAKRLSEYPTPVANAEWKASYCFGPDILRQVDPLPSIVQTLMELQKLHKFKQDIFVIFKELFVNAVDHGLLRLDSSFKSGPHGFSAYMQERDKRLAALAHGIVSIEIIHSVCPQGGILDVYVYDSGEGFDVAKIMGGDDQDDPAYHGMGLRLLNKICTSLEFNDKGNEVHARYIWHA